MSLLVLIGQLFYFFLPAAVANMSPVIFKNVWKGLAKPIDGGRTWKGKRIFGDHKTWRGLLVGTLAGGVVFLFQLYIPYYSITIELYPVLKEEIWEFGLDGVLPIWFGFGMGFAAIAGDAIKSFFKRRVNVEPGKSWFPFDQLDFILGAALYASIFVDFTLTMWILMLTIGPALHIAVNRVGFWLKLKDTPW